MKKIIMSLLLILGFTTSTMAEKYTLVVPNKPGSGLSVWSQIVATEMNKYIDGEIILKHLPGKGNIIGANDWHTDLQKDDTVMLATSGGNAIKFLTNPKVVYDYNYDAIGIMNLNIVAAKRTGTDGTVFPKGLGHAPEAFAIAMLMCGPDMTVDQYKACFKEKVTWVPGMKQNEFRLTFKRGETTGSRENPAAFKKHIQPIIDEGKAEIWFHHGILDAETGQHKDDPNFPGYQFEIVFEKKWGVAPSGEFYDAYKLVKSVRDGIQKAIFISKGSKHAGTLRNALEQVANNPDSVKAIQKKIGKYGWTIGEDGNRHLDVVMSLVTESAYKTLIDFTKNSLGHKVEYKVNIVNGQ